MQTKSLIVTTALLCVLPLTVNAADWNPFPDTGQTLCYDVAGTEIACPAEGQALHGQDAQYDGPAQSFLVSVDGTTVTDQNTTLMWQQTDDGAIRTWLEAEAYCDQPHYGYSDWRLPEKLELQSIVDYGHVNPAINPVFLAQSSYYWSATTYAFNTEIAWLVNFSSGDDSANSQTNDNYVRCVRAGL